MSPMQQMEKQIKDINEMQSIMESMEEKIRIFNKEKHTKDKRTRKEERKQLEKEIRETLPDSMIHYMIEKEQHNFCNGYEYLDEAATNKIRKHGKDGYVLIAANPDNDRSIRIAIQKARYNYTPLVSVRPIEPEQLEVRYDQYYIVYNHKRKDEPSNLDDLIRLARDWGGTYPVTDDLLKGKLYYARVNYVPKMKRSQQGELFL